MMTAVQIYEKLYETYGEPRWWSDNPYYVMVQSILVQNTTWSSVEKVTDLMGEKINPECIENLDSEELESMIRSCGFAKRKAETIKRLTYWYKKYDYNIDLIRRNDKKLIREELLSTKGIGAETADVILVYAIHKASFIIDAYTRRFLERLGFSFHSDEEIRDFFEDGLGNNYQIYGWCHWLILEHGIQFCKKLPKCDGCAFTSHCMKK